MSAPSASPIPRAATIGRIEFEPEHREPEATDLADHVLGRDPHVVEQELAGVDALTPILSSVRPTETPGHARSTMKHGDAVVRPRVDRPGLGEHAVPVGLHDARHPALGAGEDPVVAVAHGPGAHAHHVAAGLRLGEAEAGALLAGRDRRDVLLLLLLAARDQHRPGGQAA